MRLAALMHRPVAELRETMDAHEWSRWLLFHSLYDLPDAFMVVGQICSTITQVVGGKGIPGDFAPFYKVDPGSPDDSRPPDRPKSDLRQAFNFIASYAKERAAQGKPLPKEKPR